MCFVDLLNFLDVSVAGCFIFFFNKLMINVRLSYVRIGGNLSYRDGSPKSKFFSAATVDKRGASFKDMSFCFNNLVPDFGSSI